MIVVLALGMFALGAFWERDPSLQQPSPIFPSRSSAQLSTAIENVFDSSDIVFTSSETPQEYSRSSSNTTSPEPTIRWIKHDYSASLDDHARLSPVVQQLSDTMTVYGGEIFQTYIEPENHQARLVIGVGTFITHHIVFTWPPPPVIAESPPASTEEPAAQFRAAIVIDDLGANTLTVQRLLDLQADLTFSVLPHLEKSTEVAQLLHNHQREIFLHLHDGAFTIPRPISRKRGYYGEYGSRTDSNAHRSEFANRPLCERREQSHGVAINRGLGCHEGRVGTPPQSSTWFYGQPDDRPFNCV